MNKWFAGCDNVKLEELHKKGEQWYHIFDKGAQVTSYGCSRLQTGVQWRKWQKILDKKMESSHNKRKAFKVFWRWLYAIYLYKIYTLFHELFDYILWLLHCFRRGILNIQHVSSSGGIIIQQTSVCINIFSNKPNQFIYECCRIVSTLVNIYDIKRWA